MSFCSVHQCTSLCCIVFVYYVDMGLNFAAYPANSSKPNFHASMCVCVFNARDFRKQLELKLAQSNLS